MSGVVSFQFLLDLILNSSFNVIKLFVVIGGCYRRSVNSANGGRFEAQEHAELTKHANFVESTEAVLNLVCSDCGKPCRSKTVRLFCCIFHADCVSTVSRVVQNACGPVGLPEKLDIMERESDLHTKRTGHTEFVDKTSETVKPIILEAPKLNDDVQMEKADVGSSSQQEEMVVPEVSQQLLAELEEMGFSKERAIRALHFSGNSSLEDAANWIVEHDNDPDIDKMLLVPVSSKQPQAPKPSLTPEELKLKQQELRERARKKKEEEEKRMEREREKERIRVGRELLEAKRIEEENERKRILALRKAEKEEERRAREKIRQKLEEDKAERRRKLGLPVEESSAAKSSAPVVEEKKSFLPVRPATKAEQMRECLRTLKQNHKDDDAKVKMAFNTLLTFAKNVATNPNEEKFRKIRITNANFQERVGKLKGGIEFLELCGFEKMEGGEFLYLSREKVDIAVLHSAGSELNSAINNPFFGVL
ncbi:ubiquitin-associated domain-containing family protein [Striga asiatica]|uniref:Ubiquitin-associated domain-containing family protein n=1 Tax=Striga asiatica TaxID=4170 RepID=A0A5A7P7N0_STRAF|nr:ubiquitin-associated domain-containing family protein [Striga asiatica]